MVSVYKDILYANIENVDQYNCYLDLYLPDSENNNDLYSKVEQFSDRTFVENESSDKYISSLNSDTSEHRLNDDHGHEEEKEYTDGSDTGRGENAGNTVQKGLPFVLFLHGGGWRRGGRAAWKHYLYFDVNFLVAFLQYFAGTYDNVGRTLASNNVPCAVVSYPLTEANWFILLAEMTLSYIQCVLFVFILCIPTLGLVTLYIHMPYNVSFVSWNVFAHILKPILILTILLTNVMTAVLFIFKRLEFGFKSSHVIGYSALMVMFASMALMSSSSLSNVAIITLVLNQCMIFNTRYRRSGSSYESQVQAVAQAVRWAKRFSQDLSVTDERKLFLMGHSAGGHLATLSVLDDSILMSVSCTASDLKGIISVSGVYDLLCLNKPFLRPAYLHPTFGQNSDAWKDASPEHRVKKIHDSSFFPKFLLVCAEKDLFLKQQSYQFSQTLDKMNLECRHVEIQGTNHFTIITDSRTIDGSPLSYVLDFVNK